MRIMLMWPEKAPETAILFEELKAAGHEVVYWVGLQEGESMTPKGAVFHDHYDAWDAKPAEALRSEKISPPNAELISSMYETESLILSMMNKRYDKEPVDERKHIYYTMLSYWKYVLDKFKPDWIVYAQLPHSLYSNIVYDLAKARSIPTLCFEDTWIAYRSIGYRDFWKGSEDLQQAIERIHKKGISAHDLGDEMRQYWEKRVKPQSRIELPYITFQRKTGEGWGLFVHRIRITLGALRTGTIFSLLWGYLRRTGKANLKREYTRYVKEVDWNIPFVYFPLHFQPERTTTPQGGIYHDQILAVETLSAALPEGWQIFVKEHPSQWWLRTKERYSSSRYPGYYKRLASIPHVRLVPITTNTFDLTDHAKTVAVITGTAGWEALFRGKSPLVFGIPWWRDCPGLFRVNSVESCQTALAAIKNGASSSQKNVLSFLKALEEVSVRAYLEDPHEENMRLSPEDNMRVMGKFVCEFLQDA